MAIDLEAMRAKLEQSKNGGKKNQATQNGVLNKATKLYEFYQLRMAIRSRNTFFHYNVGKNPGLLCPKKNHGGDCPICDFASKLWREGVDNNDEVAKKEAKATFCTQSLLLSNLGPRYGRRRCKSMGLW